MRKEKMITLDDRGNKLTFRIKEMPAMKLESWLLKAGLLLAGSGMFDSKDISSPGEAIQKAGAVLSTGGVSALGGIDFDKLQPLLDDLLRCCVRVDAGIEQEMTPEIVDGVIEDIRTLFALRKEALALNLDFFGKGNLFASGEETQSQGPSKPKISLHSAR